MKHSLAIFSACILAAVTQGASAQQSPEGTVTGQGVVQLKRQPDILRVQINLLAKGKDLKEALAKLKERREAARTQLVSLGCDKSAIDFGEPAITTGKTDYQRQMEMMIVQRLRSKGKKLDPKSQPVVVSATVKADFPLKAANAEDFLVSSHNLQEKIKAADLGGLKEFGKLSAEEEEISEEMQGVKNGYMGEQGPKPGEPIFLYVSKVSDVDRDKALAEAFQKAKREAARLAHAAGAELGPLTNISESQQADPNEANRMFGFDNPYAYQYYQTLQRAMQTAASEDTKSEAIGMQSGKVTLRIGVFASFRLKPTGSK